MVCPQSVPAKRFRCSLRSSDRPLRVGGWPVTATGVKPPKVQRKEMHFLDAEQVEWLAAVAELRYRPLILFAAYTGLRPCELVALRVGRLDLLRCTARVVEAAVEVSRLEWGPVKTHEARVVRMPQSVAEEVAASLAARPHRPEALMFTAPMVARSVGPISSGTASSQLSLPRTRQSPSCRRTGARPRCRTACGSTIIGIPALACSSPRREHQGGAGAAGACDRQHHPRHLWAPVPVPRWRRSLTAWRWCGMPPWRSGHGPSTDPKSTA
jgi:integrase